MGGKASLILVMGFSIVLSYISFNLNSFSTQAIGNMSSYYEVTASHNLALAGANTGLAKFYQDTTWVNSSMTQSFNTALMTGAFTVRVTPVGTEKLMLRSVASYPSSAHGTIYDTVEVYFARSKENSFSMYAWMTNDEGGVYWITKDTVWGRVHTNGTFSVNGKPAFMQKATTVKGFSPKVGTGTNSAIFKNGYETGVAKIQYPSDFSGLVNASNAGGRHYSGNIYVTLSPGSSATGDGKAYIRSSSTGPVIDSIGLSDPTFNGVLRGEQRVYVQGKLDGKLSILASTDLYITDDITYEQNPLAGSSDDMLGLIAESDLVVADNTANRTNCVIDAALFTRTGSFRAENYSTRPVSGTLQLLGSIVQNTRGAVGTFSGSTITSGFSKRYRYDDRFAVSTVRPPFFPGYFSQTLAIANWWESYRVTQPE
jgi:hypothetical protein